MDQQYYVVARDAFAQSDAQRRIPYLTSLNDFPIKENETGWFVVKGNEGKQQVARQLGGIILLLPDDIVEYWKRLFPDEASDVYKLVNSWAVQFRNQIDDEKGWVQRRTDRKANDVGLSTDEKDIVYEVLKKVAPNKEISIINNYELRGRDFQRLNERQWLNDNIIGAALSLLQRQADNDPQTYWKVWIPSTHFFELLTQKGAGYNYDRVKKWTSKIDIFSLDKILIPIHLGYHWALAVVNIRLKRIEFYDSMCKSRGRRQEQKYLQKWLEDEYQDKKKRTLPWEEDDWKIMQSYADVPQQTNEVDCGVFVLQYANYLARREADETVGICFPFTQKDIPCVRRKLALDLVRNSDKSFDWRSK